MHGTKFYSKAEEVQSKLQEELKRANLVKRDIFGLKKKNQHSRNVSNGKVP